MRDTWLQILLVGAGGFAGAVLRVLVTGWVQRLAPDGFPFGTLMVNVVGCGLLGVLAGYTTSRGMLGSELRALLVVGVLGAFTTFSTFSCETLLLLRDGALARAAANVVASIVLCLVAVWLGHALGSGRFSI
jgi:CrcB protein